MKKTVSLVMIMLLLVSYCFTPFAALAEDSIATTAQPKSVSAAIGELVTFEVTALNADSYQWYYRISPKAEWTLIETDATSPVYSLTVEAGFNGYQYRCMLANKTEQVFTDEVTLTVVSDSKTGISKPDIPAKKDGKENAQKPANAAATTDSKPSVPSVPGKEGVSSKPSVSSVPNLFRERTHYHKTRQACILSKQCQVFQVTSYNSSYS